MSSRSRGRKPTRRRVAPPSSPKPVPAARPSRTPAQPASPGRRGGKAPAPQATADPLVGRVLGRCRIEALIGEGRTSRVYRAHHQALDATVAVKVLRREAAARPELVESFEREARAIAKIDNENVLKIYDVGSEGELHYLVMELLDGEEVLDLIAREKKIDVMDALRIARQAANGLAAAHDQHIVHRDVKPQNLVLLEDGTVKVVDFGLALAERGEGQRVGTPHYMAPEVCRDGATEERSDVYSLGIVLYHLLVGTPPYAGSSVPDILRAHMKGEPLHPERQRLGLQKDVSDLVRELTKFDPVVRPTAAEVVDKLDRIGGKALQEKESLRRRRKGAGRGRTRSNNTATIFAGVAVLGGIVLVIALSSGGKDEEPRRPPATPPLSTQPSTPAGTTPSAPPPTAGTSGTDPDNPPAETEAAKQARRENEAAGLLKDAESWARANWYGPADTQAVVERYRSLRHLYPETKAGKEADMRVRQINSGRLHPHPDKVYTDEDVIRAAREAWDAARPEVEQLILAGKFFDARSKIPEQVQDPSGKLQTELAFWREYLDHLVLFQVSVAQFVKKLPEEDRALTTPQGPATFVELQGDDIRAKANGADLRLAWKDVQPAELAKMAMKAFRKEGGGDRLPLQLMAYAFAHDLWNEFSEVNLDLELAGSAAAGSDLVKEWKQRFQARHR